MDDHRKQPLADLGADVLADALLELAAHIEEADNVITRLLATPQENVQRFKKRLSALKSSRRFIDWRGASRFARELAMLLQDITASTDDPLTGVELVVAFYEADNTIFEMCDDSSGNIGDVFRYDAKELFVNYASRCHDKVKIADIVLQVNRKNDYGIRDTLIDSATEYLPTPIIRTMITTLQQWVDQVADEFGKRRYWILIESLARQIKDAPLFEKTRRVSWGKLSTAAMIDIARVYLESDDIDTAHAWLKKIPESEAFKADEREQLLRDIYQKQGDTQQLTELLHQRFRSYHSVDTLQALLDVIGNNQRDTIIQEAMNDIMASDKLVESDAAFLIAIKKIDEAEVYLLKHADQINGDYYGSLLPLAEAMQSAHCPLVASMIYRSLLTSILERGNTKSYTHGIRYLQILDKLSASITDWRHFCDHEAFKVQLIAAHGRKRSFWSKYEAKQ